MAKIAAVEHAERASREGWILLLAAVAVSACSAGAPESSGGTNGQPTTSVVSAAQDDDHRAVSVYSHCGIHIVTIDGRDWVADVARPEPRPVPDNFGVTTYSGYTGGYVETVGPELLRFVYPDPEFPGGLNSVILRPGSQTTTTQPCA